MEEDALPIRPRFLLMACAGALSLFAVSATIAWRQLSSLDTVAAAQPEETALAARREILSAVPAERAPPAPTTAGSVLAEAVPELVTMDLVPTVAAEAVIPLAGPELPPAVPAQMPPASQPAPTSPLVQEPAASARALLRICAGSPTGNYTFAAREIATRLAVPGEIEVLATAGSGENLRRLAAGDCELGFSQADVLALRTVEHPEEMAGLDPLKRVYGEYVHLLCPTASGWTTAGALDGRARLILGGEGSGTAETWRAFTKAVPALRAVQRVNDPVNLVAVNRVKDSRDTCMLWISGLNSGDMQGANRMSTNTPDGRRTMRLVAVSNPELRGLRLADGQPIYRFEGIDARSGAYENLLDPRSGPLRDGKRPVQPGSVVVPVVDAVLVVRRDFLARLPGRGSEIVAAVEEAGPAIWARVSPRR
ncbi:TAXI family TRAP transporter solute-binding subunit [Muricoccus aerilatus]|uniref:TAXI family TRAP transporter solute-binding subunit n=1 Tax=Muricoccus aerilatus TaxID=452982 RepID=UPI00069441D9|nr:TAXI family TRAP transporter solute-binding subunit [Roseomonas aerilata]